MKIKATVAYDGYAYNGFQKQINGLGIQDVIEKALGKIHKYPTSVTASGRTDARVHATGQVFHFEKNPRIDPRGYYQALNTLLPKDIRIVKTEEVPDDFHARFSARQKRYEYVCTLDGNNPFAWKYKVFLKRRPDLNAMRQTADIFLGRHDFTSFTHAKIDSNKPRTKNIRRIDILEEGNDLRFIFEADGFLRYQVRMMMGTILAAGDHKISAEDVRQMLEARNKEACRFNAPAHGLYLTRVFYEEDMKDPHKQVQSDESDGFLHENTVI